MIFTRIGQAAEALGHEWRAGLGATLQVWVFVLLLMGAGAVLFSGGPIGSKEAAAQVHQSKPLAITVLFNRGPSLHVSTEARTVGAALSQLGIPLGANVVVSPGLAQTLTAGETIQVTAASAQPISLTTALSYPVIQVADKTLAQGLSVLVQGGQSGVDTSLSQPSLAFGALAPSQVLRPGSIRQAVPELVLVGTTPLAADTYHGAYLSAFTVKATAYWRNPEYSNGRTATGATVAFGSIAVDPAVIPLGSQLFVQGYGLGVADDTGSDVIGLHVDLYFPTLAEARAWGMRYVTVYVISRG